jgi:nitrate/nitrite transporter NarK
MRYVEMKSLPVSTEGATLQPLSLVAGDDGMSVVQVVAFLIVLLVLLLRIALMVAVVAVAVYIVRAMREPPKAPPSETKRRPLAPVAGK